MAYSLSFAEDVRRWIRDCSGLSREGRVRLFTNVDHVLRNDADRFRNDPDQRPNPPTPVFVVDIVLEEPPGSRQLRVFHLYVSDRAAAMGVLHVVYIDAD